MSPSHLTFKNRCELQLARWIRRFYLRWPRRLESSAPAAFPVYRFGSGQPNRQGIPPIIWAYWNGPAQPLVVQRCFENWHASNPGFSIRILDDSSVKAYIDHIPPGVNELPVAKRADWIRLELLRLHGGIWLDASTILTESLDWVLALQAREQSDFVGYYLERYTRDAEFPVVESWFMAAPPGSPFIVDLQREFTTQVVPRTGAEYIAHLQAQGLYEAVRQNIDIPEYLSIHLAMQLVLRSGSACRLCLGKAEDGPFFYHVLGAWGRTPLKIRLLFSRAVGAQPALIKLRAPDRKRLDDYLGRGLYVPGSIADIYLMKPADRP